MGTQTDYFEKIGYKPKYFLGDRVHGKFAGIPFVGTVGNDRVIDNTGPQIIVHLDLPMKVDKIYKTLIIVKHKDIKRLSSWEDTEPLKLKEAGSSPAKRTKQQKVDDGKSKEKRNEKRKS